MTLLTILLNLSGLSQREAAAFLEISPSSVDKMSRGVRSTPDGIFEDLSDLIDRQERAADTALDLITEQAPDSVTLGYPSDDTEARSLGWPSVSAWCAMAARVVVFSPVPVQLVARGSEPATALAADLNDATSRK